MHVLREVNKMSERVPTSSIRFRQHRVTGRVAEPSTITAINTSALLKTEWIGQWRHVPGFLRYCLCPGEGDGVFLMAELSDGRWWLLGDILSGQVDLPMKRTA